MTVTWDEYSLNSIKKISLWLFKHLNSLRMATKRRFYGFNAYFFYFSDNDINKPDSAFAAIQFIN